MENKDVALFESPVTKKNCILAILHYFVGYMFLYPTLLAWICAPFTKGEGIPVSAAMILCVVVMVVMVYLLKPVYQESWENFKKDIVANIGYIILFGVLLFVVSIISSLVIMLLTGLDTSVNQAAIEEMFGQYPFYVAFSAVVFAPIVEEGLFRGVFFRGFSSRNMILAYLVSSLLFGFIHVADSVLAGNLLDVVFIFVYANMGLVFALLYHKSDQMISGILLHALYNGLSILALFMTL